MFWKNKESNSSGPKLSGPKGIPELAGRYMVVEMNKNPDWVWTLKAVVRDVGKKQFYCRVFDESQAAKAGVQVKDWTSLDGHADLILFEGYIDKEKMTTRPEKFAPPASQ